MTKNNKAMNVSESTKVALMELVAQAYQDKAVDVVLGNTVLASATEHTLIAYGQKLADLQIKFITPKASLKGRYLGDIETDVADDVTADETVSATPVLASLSKGKKSKAVSPIMQFKTDEMNEIQALLTEAGYDTYKAIDYLDGVTEHTILVRGEHSDALIKLITPSAKAEYRYVV